MTRRAAQRALLVAAALGVAVGGGCAEGEVLDGSATAATIEDRLGDTYAVDLDSVECPDDVPVEDGREFRCRARVGVAVVDVEVIQTDDEGTLQVTSEAAILSTAEVEGDIAATLAERFGRDDVEVTCAGPDVRVELPGATFPCAAVDGEETGTVEVEVRNESGALTYSIVEE